MMWFSFRPQQGVLVANMDEALLAQLRQAAQKKHFRFTAVLSWQEWLRRAPINGITYVVFDLSGTNPDQVQPSLLMQQKLGATLIPFNNFYEQVHRQIWFAGFSLSHLAAETMGWRFYARLRDVVWAIIGLGLTTFLLPCIASAIWLESGLPILYSQTRTGKNGIIFKLFKFRTMRQDAEQDGQVRWADLNDPRVTRVGRFLRRTRLDELPQFWNVVKGEMSLIGPRPERPEFIEVLEKDIPFYRTRLLVKPGLTGWAQINYKYGATINEAYVKLGYDLYYLKYHDLYLDLLIIWRTIKVIGQMTGT